MQQALAFHDMARLLEEANISDWWTAHLMGFGILGCSGAPATGENSAKLLSTCFGTGEA